MRNRLGKRVDDFPADDVAVADQPHIGGIGIFDAEIRYAQHRHEAWSILEHLSIALAFGNEAPSAVDRIRRLDGRVQHTEHGAVLVTDGCVAEGEVGRFRMAMACGLQREVFVVAGYARQRILRDRLQRLPGLAPCHPKGLAQGLFLGTEYRQEFVIVDRDQIRAPEQALRKLRRNDCFD